MEEKYAFVTYLESLVEDRGKMAALRRGLGQPPGTCAVMYPIVAPRIPRDCMRIEENRYYILSSLFGAHPLSTASGNMGDHLRKASGAELSPAVERRFMNLLETHWEDLPDQLRQTVSFLKSKQEPINWHQLFDDLKHWSHPDRYVQRRWANAFWGMQKSDENDKEKGEKNVN